MKNNLQTLLYLLLLAAGLATIIYSMSSIGRKSLTPTESNLLAISLTISSIFVSWVITTLYHNAGMSKAMRDKDVQRANAIQSVKKQIEGLRNWNRVQMLTNPNTDLTYKYHCDHLNEAIGALDCQFDTMLKDIGGTIGDADRQADELLGTVQEIGSKINSLESEKAAIEAKSVLAETSKDYDLLQNRISEITNEQETLKQTIAEFVTTGVVSSNPALMPRDIDCPYCESHLQIPMAGFPGETRQVGCVKCHREFNAHCTGEEHFISRGLSSVNATLAYPDQRLLVKDTISPPGFSFTPQEFRLLSDSLLANYVPREFSIKTLNEAVSRDVIDAGIGKSRSQKFIQLLHWRRLFLYEQITDLSGDIVSVISNPEITRDKLAQSFFGSVGFRMASVRPVTQKEVTSDIERYLKVTASDLDAAQLAKVFMEGYAAGQIGSAEPGAT